MWRMALFALIAISLPASAEEGPGISDLMRARSFGMGGAFRALGGGTEAVEANPASMAVFRRYVIELCGAWDPRNPFGFGSIAVMDSASSAVAAGLAYHIVSLGAGDEHRVAHLNTGALTIPFGQTLYIGASFRHVLMSGSREVNAITGDAGLLLRLGPMLASVSGHNLVDIADPDFPRTFAAALGLITPEFSLAADLQGNFNGARPAYAFSGGGEWVVGGVLPLRAGYMRDLINGGTFIGAGLGFLTQSGALDLSYRHELGGNSSRLLALTIRFQIQ